MQIVHHRKAHAEHFVRLEQMAQIRAGKIAAAFAIARRIYRALIQLILRIFDVDDPLPGILRPV